jgi:hypothetical protein
MEHRPGRSFRWFARVTDLARALPSVELADKYDGSPVLRVGGCFMAGMATHRSAEPESLTVRADPDERSHWLDEAPDVYYLTEHYERHPVVLVRAGQIDDETLRDVLAASWRLTSTKTSRS